ncbi:MAG: SDR family NAD(P)-dependent oxidoreductase, partial [Patescibacteria group bacterium]|nr:SDR family NAD(P)-dependent oxidoreductase [Patescibacteria group bacterium]
MNISGKVFVVTGAASGIGKEITLALLAKGAKVAAVDLKKESLAELSKELGENSKNISTHALSVADKKAVEALPGEVITKLGQVDGVINNAGIIQPFVKINDLDYEAIDRVMGVNFYGT